MRNDVNQTDFGKTTARDIGIGGANIDDWSSGMSSVSISGYDSPLVGYSPSEPWRRSQTNFEEANTWTKILGNHTIKWGVDLNRVRNDLLQTQTFDPRGRFNFAPGPDLHAGTGQRHRERICRVPAGPAQPGGPRPLCRVPDRAAELLLLLRPG